MNVSDVESFFQALFRHIQEDPAREGLKDTPKRFLKSFEELTRGYSQEVDSVVNGALFECENTQPVVVDAIPYYSLCEHHLLPFFGHCRVVYVPNGRVLGLSKIYRIIDMFSHRLQLQERLTQQIGETLLQVTQATGVAVEMTGEHLCVAMRGVRRAQSFMRTQYRTGSIPETLLIPQAAPLPAVPAHPQQQLVVRTLALPLYLGCNEEEQRRPTMVEITISLQMSGDFLPQKDQLSDTICYDALIRHVWEQCLEKRYHLIECACGQVYRTVHQFLETQSFYPQVRVHLRKTLEHDLLRCSEYQISEF